jgi:RNA-binding protein Tab2/Atab2
MIATQHCLLLIVASFSTSTVVVQAFVPSRSFPSASFGSVAAFPTSSTRFSLSSSSGDSTTSAAAPSSSLDKEEELLLFPNVPPSADWELDCYSRPVVVAGGKKLWEVLLTDATGSFRYRKTLPSNAVNSKALRQVVENVMEQVDTKPGSVRFFRGAMFNMINIALKELDVVGRPSRCTISLAQWLEERHRSVYPKMEGYERGNKRERQSCPLLCPTGLSLGTSTSLCFSSLCRCSLFLCYLYSIDSYLILLKNVSLVCWG